MTHDMTRYLFLAKRDMTRHIIGDVTRHVTFCLGLITFPGYHFGHEYTVLQLGRENRQGFIIHWYQLVARCPCQLFIVIGNSLGL